MPSRADRQRQRHELERGGGAAEQPEGRARQPRARAVGAAARTARVSACPTRPNAPRRLLGKNDAPRRQHAVTLHQGPDQDQGAVEREEGRQRDQAIEVAQGGQVVPGVGIEQRCGREPGLRPTTSPACRARRRPAPPTSPGRPRSSPRPGTPAPAPAIRPAPRPPARSRAGGSRASSATSPSRSRQSSPDVASAGAVQVSPATRQHEHQGRGPRMPPEPGRDARRHEWVARRVVRGNPPPRPRLEGELGRIKIIRNSRSPIRDRKTSNSDSKFKF